MRINSILVAPNWLSPAELKLFNKFKRAFCADIKRREIPMNPFLALRIYDVCVAMLYLRRAENALCVPEGESPAPIDLAVFDTLAKHQDRLRKLLKDLEQHLSTAAKTAKQDAEKAVPETFQRTPEIKAETPVEQEPTKAAPTKPGHMPPKTNSGPNLDYAKLVKDGRYVLSSDKKRAEEELRQLSRMMQSPGL